MATPVGDSYGVASGGVIAAGRYRVSPFWRDLPSGWSDITPSGTRPPFGILGFSGSAWDSASGKMYIQGGGHADYGGNEVWEFDYENRPASFVKHYEPDFTSIYGVGTPEQQYAALAPFVDNTNYPGAVMSGGSPVRPISRHTYGSVVFMPWLGKFTVGGGSTFSGMTPVNYWDNVWPNSPGDFWFYDPIGKAYQYRGARILDANYKVISTFSAHETRRRLFGIGGDISNRVVIHEYDPSGNTWVTHPNLGPNLNVTGAVYAIDEVRDRLVVIMKPSASNSVVWQYDLTTQAWSEIVCSGQVIGDLYNEPRCIHSHKTNSILLLQSYSAGMLKLDLDTNVWTLEAISGPAFDQTSGNWFYDKKRQVCLLTYQHLSNGIRVWAYKE